MRRAAIHSNVPSPPAEASGRLPHFSLCLESSSAAHSLPIFRVHRMVRACTLEQGPRPEKQPYILPGKTKCHQERTLSNSAAPQETCFAAPSVHELAAGQSRRTHPTASPLAPAPTALAPPALAAPTAPALAAPAAPTLAPAHAAAAAAPRPPPAAAAR